MDVFPLVDAYLIVEMVSGFEHIHPFTGLEPMMFFYKAIILGPSMGKSVILYSLKVPEDVAGGDYSLEAYSKTKRTKT